MEAVYILLRAVLAIAAIIALTRMNGLRSFSKMSGFDFAITVAKGSVLASTVMATSVTNFWVGIGALVALYIIQAVLSRLRSRIDPIHQTIDNQPLLLMRNGKILDHNLTRGQLTRDDLMGKLRESNALRLQDVRAVVLEPTGDVSVLHGDKDVDDALLDGVRG